MSGFFKIFISVLFVGCADDGALYNVPRTSHPQTGQNFNGDGNSDDEDLSLQDIDFEFSPQEIKLFEEINIYREQNDLSVLDLSPAISYLCRSHSDSMATGAVEFGHEGFQNRVDELSSEFSLSQAAENVGMSSADNDPIDTAIENWLESEGHRINIEGSFGLTGVGVTKSSDGYFYLTQIFLAED